MCSTQSFAAGPTTTATARASAASPISATTCGGEWCAGCARSTRVLETDQAAVLATHMERRQRREARLARRGRDNPLPLPGLPHSLAVERPADKPEPPEGRGRWCLTSHPRTDGAVLWRAGCRGIGTPGSAGGPGKRPGGNAGTAPRLDPTGRECLLAPLLRALLHRAREPA